AQKRLYFLQQMDLESTAYNMPLILPVGKEINRQAFESTLKQLIARHESLRTSFIKVNDAAVQKIHPPEDIEFEIEYYDLATEDTDNRKQETKEILQDKKLPTANCQLPTDFVRPFDLSGAPLVRSGIIRHPGGNHTWIVDIHHIVSDGTSHMILADDFMSFYEGNSSGLEPLRLQYKDFSQWQNGLFASGVIKAQED
ncbi:MAG: hypothetical protein GTO45_38530, partial [Candidatus Aminicenantes bacterium]|nr:hypothetical protein [Candidatus Aminicenantes bacterium]NIM84516.1 hypothetical protein [Candidatus Aminicenantes bacterium]NIN24041.1 hypothetical protein [Candidatus Aminicenantes bacterium]NIN47157.1 hypothetical protein [Candidatus Aminicenantes bacterium]NIN90685.1 hypothetical protein [Candidatus Aminicenantes bacterium]